MILESEILSLNSDRYDLLKKIVVYSYPYLHSKKSYM
jgi:hypothetical protein